MYTLGLLVTLPYTIGTYVHIILMLIENLCTPLTNLVHVQYSSSVMLQVLVRLMRVTRS